MNLSGSSPLWLTGYGPPGPLAVVSLVATAGYYGLTLASNLLLAAVIVREECLHTPQYWLLLHLALNGLLGSSAVCPTLLGSLLDPSPHISYTGCLLQVWCVNMYASCVYALLTAMAYDRYLYICRPLHYHVVMTPGRVRALLGVAYLLPASLLTGQVVLTSRLALCRSAISKLFCDNLALLQLACQRSAALDGYGMALSCLLVALPFLLVVLSYARILAVSLRASPAARLKALRCCGPHLLVTASFSACVLFSLAYNRLQAVPRPINHLVSAQFLLPPLLHPLVYGLKVAEVRGALGRMLRGAGWSPR